MVTSADPDGARSPGGMLTVAVVARRLGVAPSTLRTWDRRYGLGPSAHTAGSHRRYSPADVERLLVMRRLTMEGVQPGEAAIMALAPPAVVAADLHDDAGPRGTVTAPARHGVRPATAALWPRSLIGIPIARHGSDDPRAVPLRAQVLSLRAGGGPGRAGGGRVMALPFASPQARGLARAAMALDSHQVTRLLREAVSAGGVVDTWDCMAMPVLQAIGERWSSSGDVVEVEHALSESLLGVLHGVCAAMPRARNSRPVLLGCAEGDQHTLPLHALAASLAQERIGTRMLGVGLPAESLAAAVRRSGPAVVFLFARLPVGDPRVLDELPRQRPAPRMLVGGCGWDDLPLPASVGRTDSLGHAVEAVLSCLHI